MAGNIPDFNKVDYRQLVVGAQFDRNPNPNLPYDKYVYWLSEWYNTNAYQACLSRSLNWRLDV